MAIKNRYFKTTQGLPFELIVGSQYTAQGTIKALVDTPGVVRDYGIFRADRTTPSPVLVANGTALAAAFKNQFVSFAMIEAIVTGKGNIKTTTQLLANTITAEVVPFTAPVNQDSSVTRTSGSIGVGQDVVVKIVETTPGNQPIPTWDYTSTLLTTEANVWIDLQNKINLKKEDEFFTAIALATGIRIISTDPTRHFRLAVEVVETKVNSTDLGSAFTLVLNAKAKAGSGTLAQIQELQIENNIRNGIGHYYTNHVSAGATAAEFGLPLDVATAIGSNFDIVVIRGLKSEPSPNTPVDHHQQRHHILLAVPAGQGAAIALIFA